MSIEIESNGGLLLTRKEAAAFLRLGARTLSVLVRRGKIPTYRPGPGEGKWFFSKVDLLRYLESTKS